MICRIAREDAADSYIFARSGVMGMIGARGEVSDSGA